MTDVKPFWLAGQPATGRETLEVHHPYDGALVGAVSVPTSEQVEQAVQAALDVQVELARTSASHRAAALMHVSNGLVERAEELAQLITSENGKPIKWARSEAARAASTFRWAAEEARRWNGELMRLDTDPSAEGRLGLIRRFPRGLVLGIAPFNFPINLVAHKVAPALAIGAPVLIKPALTTPLSSLLMAELLAETDLPHGSWSVLPVANEVSAQLVEDPRIPVVSFTGSEGVGFGIADAAPRKHVVLELGGNAAAVVLKDYSSDKDLEWAATRIATFGNYQAGQSCVSVQRVIVDESLVERFIPLLAEKVAALVTGDPRDDATDVGPVIDTRTAGRIVDWVQQAKDKGAVVLAGGTGDGATVEPTLVTDVPDGVSLASEEIFGPVMTIATAKDADDAFAQVNDSRFGLQAGVFTRDVQLAFRAHAELEVGGVIIGDVPSFRADQMPYGGVKQSGVGREGLRAAMEDLSVERILVLTGIDL